MLGMRVGILGPVVAAHDGAVVDTGRPMHRAVLGLLAVHLGRVVSVDALVDGLWGDDPPESARSSLHAHVSRLRTALPDGRSVITTEGAGYTLRLPPEAIDARRFEVELAFGREAMIDGDAPSALEHLEAAVGTWRGEALSDVSAPYAAPVATRLAELRLVTEEDVLEALLACGRHAEAATRAAELVAAHPLRERAWAARITALYRCGAPAEALTAYRTVCRHLVEELGVDPSPDLRALEHRILVHDPTLAAPAPPPEPQASGRPAGVPVVARTEAVAVPPVRYATAADGVHVAYQVVGDGPVDVLVSHSYVWQLEVGWEHPHVAALWNALAERYRLLLYDKRGQGLSDRMRITDLHERALDISAVLDAVASERVVAVGNSDGAAIAAAAAAVDPRIVGLVSISGGLSLFTPDRPWAPNREDFVAWVSFLATRWGTGRSLRVMAPSSADDAATVQWMGRLERAACGPGEVRQLVEFNGTLDWGDVARRVRVPSLVIRRADETVARAACEEVADVLGARYVEVPGDEHLLYLGDHEPVLRELHAFVDGLPA